MSSHDKFYVFVVNIKNEKVISIVKLSDEALRTPGARAVLLIPKSS